METIKVKYKITLKEGKDPSEILDVICRDISWGTFIPNLSAAQNTIKEAKECEVYKPNHYQPSYTIDPDGLIELKFNADMFNFKREGINHFIGTIAGDITTNTDIQNIEIVDIVFNKMNLNDFFKGPKSGTDILKNKILAPTLNGKERPIVAFTIKPRLGLTVNQYKQIILEASKSDVDIIEDDERLVDPDYCSFDERVRVIGEIIKTGVKSKFSVNVTGYIDLLKGKVERAYKAGIRIFKLDVLVSGFDALILLREELEKYPDTAITVFPDIKSYRNIRWDVILKLSRLCGADIIYAGSTTFARMVTIDNPDKIIAHDIPKIINIHQTLSIQMGNINKKTLPTMSHDLNIKNIEILIYGMRIHNHYDYAFFIGGGISGFSNNFNIEKSCNLWMKIIKHASNVDLKGATSIKDINDETFFNLDNELKK